MARGRPLVGRELALDPELVRLQLCTRLEGDAMREDVSARLEAVHFDEVGLPERRCAPLDTHRRC